MEIINIFLHLDKYIANIINLFGPFTYIILFLIIFAETGFVVTPFLPGDSLLFVVGTLSGSGFLQIWISYFTLLSAAILGDTVNYWIGYHIGNRLFSKNNSRFFNKAHIEKTRRFYEKHGGKTIILARFVPIIRTFAPFVAGIGVMKYRTFLLYNIVGAFIWVTLLTFTGYFFGGLPMVKSNFEYAVFGIVFLSLIPVFIEYIRMKKEQETGNIGTKTSYRDIKATFKKEHVNN
ncbi:MAG: hypothetical protein UT63_C0058G0013 [Candidatus Gottesmanbacteria bacterium GW2011_GWC2_39_8]|uniref:VTT domain-containing protein n=1 Tax=Candidatus Gottesmanbacteria bacterium GW2011_GWC2_39_8 TaxID=1618450 RepID=A0A0G0T219_9BACT|nr:MAG: hypothetical protein UT63_C0058G0013 [Candidatus Gottesmanbacteria bacterium GW2011_GWC2_39_8]